MTRMSFKQCLTGVQSVYDTAPWREDGNMNLLETKKEEKIKSRQQLNKLPDESLRHWKSQNKQKSQAIVDKKQAEQFLSARRTTKVKPLFAGNVTQLVDYHPYHPVKEEKLEGRDNTRDADKTSDLFKSFFKDLFSSKMPSYSDFLLPNAEELARTPRHYTSSEAGDPTENTRPLKLTGKTPPHWIEDLATLSPDQVRTSVFFGEP